jgi:hypothetical protein
MSSTMMRLVIWTCLLLFVPAWVPSGGMAETTQLGPVQPLTRSEPESKTRPFSLPTQRPIMADPDRVTLGKPGPFPDAVRKSSSEPPPRQEKPAPRNQRSGDRTRDSKTIAPSRSDSPIPSARSRDKPEAPASNAAAPAASPRGKPTTHPESGTDRQRTTGWTNRFESTGRRPMRTFQTGSGQTGSGTKRILILGSIHGNEPASIALLDALARRLESVSVPSEVEMFLVRTPNPDGLAERIQTNQRGVDLNRNFPSTWFTATPTRETGPYPASEVETQQLLRLFREFDPVRVIHVRAGSFQRPLVTFNRHWQPSSSLMLRNRADLGGYEGDFPAGSLEEFVSLRLRAELATVWLPETSETGWNADDLLTLAWDGIATARESAASSGNGTGARASEPRQDPPPADGERGYVEFLPPPPKTGTDASSSRYYELPPPSP